MEQIFPCQPITFLLIYELSFKFYKNKMVRNSLTLIPTHQVAGLAESRPPSSSSCHRASVLPIDRDRSVTLHTLFASTGLKLQDTKSGPVTESSGTDSWVFTGPDSTDYETTLSTISSLSHPRKWFRAWLPRGPQRGPRAWAEKFNKESPDEINSICSCR